MEDTHWYEDFADKHPNPIVDGAWLLFEDGARCERSAHGCKFLPPEDPQLLREILLRYWSLKTSRLATAFNEKKQELQLAASAGRVAPSDADIAELEQLQQEVLAAQEAADALVAEEEVEAEEEYERAKALDKQLTRTRRKLKMTQRRVEEARRAGHGSVGRYRKFSQEAAVLRREANELSRQWRQCSGEARHRVQMEKREAECEEVNAKLDEIEI